ncbi:MAG: LemA family protein [Flavobacteriales bacterium]|nr:LemA family protein [Flavobacteriales bacterium]
MNLLIPIGIVAVLIIAIIVIYNGLISKKNSLDSVTSTLDIILQKRYDLIPNLVSSVREYMKHEAGTLTEITRLREAVSDGGSSQADRFEKENQLSEKLKGLSISVENYPDLKASDNFIQLQRSLNEIEEQLSAARRAYNASALNLNNAREQFPSNIIAGMMKLKEAAYYEAPAGVQEKPDVKALFNS